MFLLAFAILLLELKSSVWTAESNFFNISDDDEARRVVIPIAFKENQEEDIFRIIGGQNAADGDYPWMAALYKNGRFLCTFSVISPSWLLGAAHCVVRLGRIPHPPGAFSAIVGNVNRTSSDSKVTFSDVVVHSGYGRLSVRNDIALLRMSKPLELNDSVRAICIPRPERTFEGKMAHAMGWGNTRKVGQFLPEILQVVQVDVANRGWCGFIYWLLGFGSIFISKDQLCAGSNRAGVCHGDSGGPLIYDNGSKNVTIGVTSFGTWVGCAPLGVPAVYTAVSRYNEWIKMNVDEEICES